tara:strand:+ start:12 stop:374 length:363 start_codon:yes stop_codon:yes gene_type:complete
MEIYKDITFEAAHLLPNLPNEHKCRQLHGHSFKLRITISGSIDKKIGWVQDFSELKSKFKPIYNLLDHHYLNEIEGLENPTSENILIWIWKKLKPSLPMLLSLEIKETCTTGCIYRGEND